jgi:RNA polymerase sigma factor (sigma-70 family)
VAYRVLGSLSEADDAVQEAWLRVSRSDTSGVDNLGGWLTTIVARVCLNMLRSRESRREEPLSAHVPDPIASRADGTDPEQQALLADSVGLALLVVLDTLAPAERIAFVLHDMFAVPFDEIAPIVGRTPAAARQLASRARRRVQAAATIPDTDLGRQREVVDAFLAASSSRSTWSPTPSASTSSTWRSSITDEPNQRCGPGQLRGFPGRSGTARSALAWMSARFCAAYCLPSFASPVISPPPLVQPTGT